MLRNVCGLLQPYSDEQLTEDDAARVLDILSRASLTDPSASRFDMLEKFTEHEHMPAPSSSHSANGVWRHTF
jgi:hypothetical protein